MDEKAKLIKDYARMCESKVGIDCDECELNKNEKYSSCGPFMIKEPEQAVEIIERWSAEHKIKTRQDMIIKEFPNIGTIGDVIDLRPCDMDTEIECPDRDNTSCTECKKSYWLAEVE